MSSQSTHVYACPRTSEGYMGEYADAPGTWKSMQMLLAHPHNPPTLDQCRLFTNIGEYPHLATQPGNAQHISNTLATH
jgi:hypothetical protein